jgi:hypothetical protein
MKFKLTQTQTFLLAAVAVLAMYGYSKGWFAGANKGYNIDPGTAPDGTAPTANPNDPKYKNIATSFRNSMLENSTYSSIFLSGCDSLLRLTDADLILVSNAYNKMYVNEDYNTLRAVLMQEWTLWSSTTAKRNELLARFNRINI